MDIAGAIITVDALHTQRAHVAYLTGRDAHYLLTVKANRLTLIRQLRALPWRDIPVADVGTDKAHGRRGQRTLKLATVSAGIGFPHAALALQVTRRSRPRNRGSVRSRRCCASPASRAVRRWPPRRRVWSSIKNTVTTGPATT